MQKESNNKFQNKKIKEINVFSVGDSSDVNLWSGVPYFFTKSIENMGVKVNKINIAPKKKINQIFNLFITKLLSFIYKRIYKSENYYSYFRSKLNYFLTNKVIIKSINKYPNSNYNIFLTYSFSSTKFSDIPVALFCDATFEKTILSFQNRQPNLFEKFTVKKEYENIKNAQYVFSLFPDLKTFIEKNYKREVHYLGKVLNLDKEEVSEDLSLNLKINNNNLLFIGRKHYIEGAKITIKVFQSFNAKNNNSYNLNIIGLNKTDFPKKFTIPENIHFYGYLRKNNKKEYNIYLSLIRSAKLFINPTPHGGTYLTTLEVMYYYTPVMIVPYKEFLKTFGYNSNKVGVMLKNTNFSYIESQLSNLLNNTHLWKKFAITAHSAVENFSWDKFAKEFLTTISN